MNLLKVKIRKQHKTYAVLIKDFQKYFMTHQYIPEIFHDPCKNPSASPPAYLMYGLLVTCKQSKSDVSKQNKSYYKNKFPKNVFFQRAVYELPKL